MKLTTVREFFGAMLARDTFNPLHNPYIIFGLCWGIAADLYLFGRPGALTPFASSPELMPRMASAVSRTETLAVLPLALGWVFGTLGTIRLKHTAARERILRLLDSEVAQRTADLREMYLQTVLALSAAIEAKSPYTHGHCQRVWELAEVAAQQLGVPEGDLPVLRNAAYLHDIGKIQVPDAVLDKPGRLTPAEYATVQAHSEKGGAILEPITGFRRVARLVRAHHERLDGSGYPDHLVGDQLTLLMRILSAADTLDAMISDRPYRKGLSKPVALAELRRCAGLSYDRSLLPRAAPLAAPQYDPTVVLAMEAAITQPRSECTDEEPQRETTDPHVSLFAQHGESTSGAEDARGDRLQCWEIRGCGQATGAAGNGPRCPVPSAVALDGVNGGHNGGRCCWAVPGALCTNEEGAHQSGPASHCLQCSVLATIRREEGLSAFRLVPPPTGGAATKRHRVRPAP